MKTIAEMLEVLANGNIQQEIQEETRSELVNDLDKMFWQIFDLGFGRITTLDAADVHCVPGAHEQSELLGGNENTNDILWSRSTFYKSSEMI